MSAFSAPGFSIHFGRHCMPAATQDKPENHVKAFASFFKVYVGVMPLVTAAWGRESHVFGFKKFWTNSAKVAVGILPLALIVFSAYSYIIYSGLLDENVDKILI